MSCSSRPSTATSVLFVGSTGTLLSAAHTYRWNIGLILRTGTTSINYNLSGRWIGMGASVSSGDSPRTSRIAAALINLLESTPEEVVRTLKEMEDRTPGCTVRWVPQGGGRTLHPSSSRPKNPRGVVNHVKEDIPCKYHDEADAHQ